MVGAVFAAFGEVSFEKAEPVWTGDVGMNANVAFEAEFASATKPTLRFTCAETAEVRLDGQFVAHGPARGPKGWFRVDELPLAAAGDGAKHRLTITVAGYRVNSFYLMDQEPFLQAEVVADGQVLAATGVRGGFAAHRTGRVRKVSRYSFQRPFNEFYRLPVGKAADEPLVAKPKVRLLPRRAPYPDYHAETARRVRDYSVVLDRTHRVRENWGHDGEGVHKGFLKEDQELCVFEEIQRYRPTDRASGLKGTLYELPSLGTGFPCVKVKCTAPTRVVMRFAEVLTNDVLEPGRDCTGNGVVWDLAEPGEYSLEAFEPYAFKFIDVIGDPAKVTFGVPWLRTYENPTMAKAQYRGDDAELREIFEAARRSIAQNALDVFTDCPGRERAGWLCDSFFSSRSAQFFSGRTDVERSFLENYLLPERFDDIPEGMVPMCYPADHPDKNFIPNWAMWFVLEVEDYLKRTGDRAFVDRLRGRVEGVVKYLSTFENPDGLLEKLPKWVFVEWSDANNRVQDVNYPSNMTWAEVLDAAARLYGRADLVAKAKKVRATVLAQSYDGTWFHDNAVRKDGKLVLGEATTETCQYYAFFFGTATPATHPKLWKRLVTEFGPARKETKAHPAVAFSNAFIGNYLRLMCLKREGLKDQMLCEIRGYFLKMARSTGTLWEMDSPTASCCHGFASYVGVLLGE